MAWWQQHAGPRPVSGPVMAITLSVSLSACATTSSPDRLEVYDPIEPVNRAIFGFNQIVDGLILEPAAELYGLIVPELGRRGIRNILNNLSSPVVFANDVLQGERERAGVTLSRFMINSTLGVAGLFDFAGMVGFEPHHDEDFGQTLAVHGVAAGPYIMLPLLGPSNVRDFAGQLVDFMIIDPVPAVISSEAQTTRTAVNVIDVRHEIDPALDDLEANSIDLYAAIRSVTWQRRQAAIRNGAAPAADSGYEDIFSEDFDDELPDE